MANLNSLISGGYAPDIDDIDRLYDPDVDCEYVVIWQSDGIIYCEVFVVFEGNDENWVFAKACAYAKEHDTLVFYREPDYTYFNPKTGKEVKTPHLGSGIDNYLILAAKPAGFTAVETDELPF